MIPFTFKYELPETIEEAVLAWKSADKKGENPLYYSGGTEIITLCRDQKIKPGTIIDIKKIPECNEISHNDHFTYGTALSLNKVIENTKSPFLAKTLKSIADHTIRNKLTLGGNIMGRLPYREAILPFLILEGSVQIASVSGIKLVAISDIFTKRMIMGKEELLINLSFLQGQEDKWFITRKEKSGRIDYPILTACFCTSFGKIKMAVSGAFSFPLRSTESEIILNKKSLSMEKRAASVVNFLDSSFRTDFRASAEYRKHILKMAITNALNYLEN